MNNKHQTPHSNLGNLVTPQNEAEHRATECDLKIRWHEVRESNQPSIVRAS